MTNLSTNKNTAGTVLILGSTGHFGAHAVAAFANAGWHVIAQSRNPSKAKPHPSIERLTANLSDETRLEAAAMRADVIVNSLNPPYPDWASVIPTMTSLVLKLAKMSGATIAFSGNVYNFGVDMPQMLSQSTPHIAKTRKGKLRNDMERAYRKAAEQHNVQTIILRCGDFLEAESRNNWFDTHMTSGLAKGKMMYPGELDRQHAWAYLPDAANALLALIEKRDELPLFSDIPFAGTTLTGTALHAAVEKAMGRPIKLNPFPWWILRLASPFSALFRETLEMRYLWNTPHQLDPAPLQKILPDFTPTPEDEIFQDLTRRYRQPS